MADVPFATAQDLAGRWRPLTSDEEAKASILLSDASDMVREGFPDIDTRLLAGELRPSTVVRVVAGMVKRAMRNEDGKRQESIDDYSWTLDREVSSGYLFLSANDRSALAPAHSGSIFSVDTVWSATY